jgi:hypothetical protein
MTKISPTPFILVSLFGLMLLIAIAFYPPETRCVFLIRKPVVGSIFIIECLMGVLAALYPRQCSRMLRVGVIDADGEMEMRTIGREPVIRGHHPDCKEFSHHVIQIDGRTFCAGCSGLVIGALVTLPGALFYFLMNMDFHMNTITFLVGCTGVVLGLLQFHLFNIKIAMLRGFLNMFFVIGTFLALVSVDRLLQDLFVDLFLISLSFFWIYTRIVISRWDHDEICKACNSNDCIYK